LPSSACYVLVPFLPLLPCFLGAYPTCLCCVHSTIVCLIAVLSSYPSVEEGRATTTPQTSLLFLYSSCAVEEEEEDLRGAGGRDLCLHFLLPQDEALEGLLMGFGRREEEDWEVLCIPYLSPRASLPHLSTTCLPAMQEEGSCLPSLLLPTCPGGSL